MTRQVDETAVSSVDWETDVYRKGLQLNRWPFSEVVSAVMRRTAGKARDAISVLEIGCGAGNNLWFLAAEGFDCHGIDQSGTAVQIARERLERLGLAAELRAGDVAVLPWPDDAFDIVIDRGALTQNSHDKVARILREAARVLKPGGLVLSFTLFGMNHPDRRFGQLVSYRTYDCFSDGYFQTVGLTSFYDFDDLNVLFGGFEGRETLVHVSKNEFGEIVDETYSVAGSKPLAASKSSVGPAADAAGQ